MDNEKRRQELLKAATESLPDSTLALAYLEHYLDLVGKLMLDITATMDQTTLDAGTKERLELLKMVQAVSSVDFANIASPLESYKIPMTAQMKTESARIRQRYMMIQMEEGLLK